MIEMNDIAFVWGKCSYRLNRFTNAKWI